MRSSGQTTSNPTIPSTYQFGRSYIPSIYRDACHPERPKVLLEREDVVDIELVAEDTAEMINERDLLIVVPSKLVRCPVENRLRHVEDIERGRRSNRRERSDGLAVADAVQ